MNSVLINGQKRVVWWARKKKMGGARGVCKQFFLNSEPETAPMQPVCVMSLGRKKARAEFEITPAMDWHRVAAARGVEAQRAQAEQRSSGPEELPRTRAERMGLSEIWLLQRLDGFSLCTRLRCCSPVTSKNSSQTATRLWRSHNVCQLFYDDEEIYIPGHRFNLYGPVSRFDIIISSSYPRRFHCR